MLRFMIKKSENQKIRKSENFTIFEKPPIESLWFSMLVFQNPAIAFLNILLKCQENDCFFLYGDVCAGIRKKDDFFAKIFDTTL